MKTFKFLVLILAIAILQGCKDDSTNPSDNITPTATKIIIGTAYNNGTKINIYSEDSLAMGYRKLYIEMIDSATGKAAGTGHVTVTPMMKMATMSHAAPVEQPDTAAINGYFTAAVVFTMPTILPDDTWILMVNFHNHSTNKEGMVNIPVSIKSSTEINSFVGSDSTKLFVTFIKMAKPVVGMNDIEFTLHKKASMMSFPSLNDLTIEMTPDMPTMGHGSPNNVNPIHTVNGHYKGKVNFTMTGQWRISLVLKKAGVNIGSTSFSITF